MRLKIELDLDEFYTENGTLATYLQDVIKEDVRRKIKKDAKYREYIKRATEAALSKIEEVI